jgi:hypothetical protein
MSLQNSSISDTLMNAVQVVARGRAEFVTCCSLSSAKPLISVEFGSKTTAFTLPESLVFSSAPNCPAAFDSQTAQILVTKSLGFPETPWPVFRGIPFRAAPCYDRRGYYEAKQPLTSAVPTAATCARYRDHRTHTDRATQHVKHLSRLSSATALRF